MPYSLLNLILLLALNLPKLAFANQALTTINQDQIGLKSTLLDSKLFANDAQTNDHFAYSISLSENRALIGAYGVDSNTGAAYIFDLIDGKWTQTARLEASDGAIDDYFGYSVSLSGDRALIGAYLEDEGGNDSGSAYIFERSGDTWIETSKLIADDAVIEDQFGYSVSLQGDRALIGAYQTDDIFDNSGSAYVFDLSAGVWNQTSKLLSTDPTENDWLGYSVSLSGNRALLGARRGHDNSISSGTAYIFELNQGLWSESKKLVADDAVANDLFGISVSLDSDRAIIGSSLNDEAAINAGAAYIFDYIESDWQQTEKLLPNDLSTGDFFGRSVSLLNNQALIGSPLDDDNGGESGSAYLFDFELNAWQQTLKITANDGSSNDQFGIAVDLTASHLIIGSELNTETISQSGSSYIFIIDELPIAFDDTYTVLQNSNPNIFSVLENDSDTDGGPKVITSVTQAIHGSVAFSNTLLSYTPNSDYCNDESIQDQFSYTLNGGSSASVYVSVTCLYQVGGQLSGLAEGAMLTLQNNQNESIILNQNTDFQFLNQQINQSQYSVQITQQPSNPNQTCSIENANGVIASSDIDNISISCNSAPTLNQDDYQIHEDSILVTLSGDIFLNDTDPETDPLFVVQPGIYPTTGVTGLIYIESDGAFEFIPNENLNGLAKFNFDVSDGMNTLPSKIQIEVVAVNDPPSFTILGDIDASDLIDDNNLQLEIINFINSIDLGPADESKQFISNYEIEIFSDWNHILTEANISSNNNLNLNFTGNYGVAILRLQIQDNGGVENMGFDTSESVEFIVAYTDRIFSNGFDDLDLSKYMDQNILINESTISYLGHRLYLNSFSSQTLKQVVDYWLDEIDNYYLYGY